MRGKSINGQLEKIRIDIAVIKKELSFHRKLIYTILTLLIALVLKTILI